MNNNIIDYLKEEINEKKLSHAFLVETNDCEKLFKDICKTLSDKKMILKVNDENNISLLIIRPENNLIDKNKILDLQKFIMTKSINNYYKFYFIINAELMNLSSFNKLLKVLEEPSDDVIGFLLTENENQIIATIRSRCKKFKYYYESASIQKESELIKYLLNIKNIKFTEILALKKEIMQNDKIEIINILNQYKSAIIKQNNMDLNNIQNIANSYKILDNVIDLIKLNVNIELCLDKMFIELRK